MNMEDMKPIILLKHVWKPEFFYCLRHKRESLLLPPSSPIQGTHVDTWNSIGQQSPIAKSDLVQSAHFSDEKIYLKTK